MIPFIEDAKDEIISNLSTTLSNVSSTISSTLNTMTSTLSTINTNAKNASSYANTAKSNSATTVTNTNSLISTLGAVNTNLDNVVTLDNSIHDYVLRINALNAPERIMTTNKESISTSSSSPTTILNVSGVGCLSMLRLGLCTTVKVVADGVTVITANAAYTGSYTGNAGWYSLSPIVGVQPYGYDFFDTNTTNGNYAPPGSVANTPCAATPLSFNTNRYQNYCVYYSPIPIYFKNSLKITAYHNTTTNSYKDSVTVAYGVL